MVKNFKQLQKMNSSAEKALTLLKVLANKDRLMLLCYLSIHEKNVTQLEEELSIPQPTLSQQLGILRRADLVKIRKEGKLVYYHLSDEKSKAVIQTLYEQFCLNDLPPF